jgi:hypothetical protein
MNDGDAFWLHKRSRKCANALSETILQQVVAFWNSKTTVSLNAKDVT